MAGAYPKDMTFTEISSAKAFGGTQQIFDHPSPATGTVMRLSVFTPDQASGVGVLFLSGLTCTEENFTLKAGAQRRAAELGLTLIAPDTSPRTRDGGAEVPDDAAYDLGQGAGFYINAPRPLGRSIFRWNLYLGRFGACSP